MVQKLILVVIVILPLITAVICLVIAGLQKVKHIDKLSRLVKFQQKEISEMNIQIATLEGRLMESRIEAAAALNKLNSTQKQLQVTENKLKAANLIIQQSNNMNGRKT